MTPVHIAIIGGLLAAGLTVGRRTPRERLAEAFKLGYAKGRRASQEL